MTNAERINEYLKSRGINDALLSSIICKGPSQQTEFIPFSAGGIDYAVHHFLDDTDLAGYGLVQTNTILNLNDTYFIAVALVEGDDVICVNTENGSVCLWLVQTGRGEWITIADSFASFLELATSKSE